MYFPILIERKIIGWQHKIPAIIEIPWERTQRITPVLQMGHQTEIASQNGYTSQWRCMPKVIFKISVNRYVAFTEY